MADLIQVRMKNFRAFSDASFDVPPRGLVLVTGQNNAGKSALFSALDVIAGQSEQENVRHANASAGAVASVWARFKPTNQERTEILGDDPKTAELLAGQTAQWLEWEFSEIGKNRLQAHKMLIAGPDGGRIVVGELRMNSPYSWDVIGPDVGIASLAAWLPGEMTRISSGSGDNPSQILENASNVRAMAAIASVLTSWRQSYFHFKPLRQGASRTADLSSIPNLESDGANLAEVLHHVQSNKPQKWREMIQLIEEIVPGVGTLMLPSQGNQFSIAFLDPGVEDFRHNLKDLGTGVEQLLMTLVVGLTANARTVVLEEPETGLHPAAQRALLSLFEEWSEAGRVFAASTHSPVLLDWAKATILSVKRHALTSIVMPVVDNQAGVLSDLGVRTSDVLAADRILVLEGVTDQYIINIWFPSFIRDPRLAIIDGGGGDAARHAQLWSSWLGQIDKLGGRKLLYIRDRDELPSDMLAKLSDSESVFVLPCRELENLLLDFEAIAAVLNDAADVATSSLYLEAQGRELADEFRSVIVMKRVARELGIHRFVDHKLRSQLASQNAGKNEFTDIVIGRLPEPNQIRAQIDAAWSRHAVEVDAEWDDRWRELVPGADLLDALWRNHLRRGYNKSSDGPLIAKRMSSPPEIMKRVLVDFMS